MRAVLSRVRHAPPLVRIATVVFTLMLVGWSVLAPLGRAPDEAAHADLVLHLASGASYPDYDGRHPSTATVSAWAAYSPGTDLGRGPVVLSPESAPPRGERRTFEEWGGDAPTASLNQMPQHPPLYYLVASSALRVERRLVPGGAASSLDREWHLLRLLSVALIAPLPLLAWAAARRLGVAGGAAEVAALVPLAIPQLLHVGSSITNDSLLVLLAAVLAVPVAGVLRGDDRRSTAVLVAVVTSFALLTKAFAGVLLAWVVLAYGVRAWRAVGDRRRWARRLLLATVPAAMVGSVWPLRNIIRHGEPMPSTLDAAFASSPDGFAPDPLWFGRHLSSSLVQRFWGDFGYYEAPLPSSAVVVATLVALVALGAALWPRRHRPTPRGPGPRSLLLFAAPLPMLLVIVAVRAYGLYASSGQTPFMQGRYLYSALVPFAVVTGAGIHRLLGRWSTVSLLAAAAGLQAVALRVALRTWWAEPDASLRRSAAAVLAWSPWPRFVVLGLVAAGLAAGAVLAVQCGWRATHRSARQDLGAA